MTTDSIKKAKDAFEFIFAEMGKVVVGQQQVIKQIIIAILTESNALLQGYPGLAKTLTVSTLAKLMDLKFSRIQGTPDLMPSDITGTYILEETKNGREFKFQPGPLFSNVVLMDEINRATPKTQSALLEAMQEHQVTVGNHTYKLERPFFVLATQNPIEQEGSLSLDETVFVNGELKTGRKLLQELKDMPVIENKNGMKLYQINGWTYALDHNTSLQKHPCLLYTLPYSDEFITITTKTGKSISVTKNHPFLINDRGAIIWKKAEELTKEDYLINPAVLPSGSTSFQIQSHQETILSMTQKPIPREISFDENFAFWIACVLSDGYIGSKNVSFCQKNYPSAMKRFISVSRSYGFKLYIYTAKNGCVTATVYSKPLVEYLRIRFGVIGGKDKEIPRWFLQFPQNMLKEFIRTFISLESCLRDYRVTFTQKSKNNISLMSYMLLRFGILSWIRYDRRIWRLKIQGEDLGKYLTLIGWVEKKKLEGLNLQRKIRSSFRVVPIDRKAVLRIVECLGLNSFHTLKGRKTLTEKPWYGGYRGIKDGEIVMSRKSLSLFVQDIQKEINERKEDAFTSYLDTNPRRYAAGIGISLSTLAGELNISHNQIWNLYKGSICVFESEIRVYLKEAFIQKIQESEQLLAYCRDLLSPHLYYDQVKTITYNCSDNLAFGLTVPGQQNYLAGFGGCGINHNTYPLPEAQSDRFLFKIKTDYPTFNDEVEIVSRYTEFNEKGAPELKPLLKKETIFQLQQLVRQIPIAQDVRKYAVELVKKTRERKELIEYGASPRASIGLVLAAKANALLDGRNYVTKNDVREMVYPVLRHRIIINFEAERNNFNEDDVIGYLLK